jgi:hypothetical protein
MSNKARRRPSWKKSYNQDFFLIIINDQNENDRYNIRMKKSKRIINALMSKVGVEKAKEIIKESMLEYANKLIEAGK